METLEEYNSAILEFCQDNPDLQIYNVGSLSHPGISDLDFLVLDKVPIVSNHVRSFLMGGNIIIMPSSIFNKINYIEQFKLNLVQGQDIQVEKVNSRYFDIIEIIEWLPERILLIESVIKSDCYNKRKIHLYLKSLDRSIKNVEKLTCSYFSRPEISDIRDSSRKYNINDVCNAYHKAGEDAWYTFSSSLKELHGTATGSISISSHYKFSNKFEKLMIYMKMLTSFDLDISRKLFSRVSINVENSKIDSDFFDFAKYRWSLLNELYCWFRSNNIKSGMVKYGWLLE